MSSKPARQRDGLPHARGPLRRHAPILQAERDVPSNGAPGEDGVLLKDIPDARGGVRRPAPSTRPRRGGGISAPC